MRQRSKKDAEPKSNKPQDSKFKQQKLDAWQPILTPSWVIGTFVLMGVIFTPIGASLLVVSRNNFESVLIYDNPTLQSAAATSGETSPCLIQSINEGYRRIQATNGQTENCMITFTFDRDVSLVGDDAELFLYYELSNFFQNHRRYVQSRSDPQLRNEVTIPRRGSPTDELRQECDPTQSLLFKNTSLIYYPCGLIATSYFNEGIQLAYFESNGTTINWTNGQVENGDTPPFSLETTNIAWDTDLAQRFRNPVIGKNALEYGTYAYLWQTYDQMSCYNSTDISQRVSCNTWEDQARIELGDDFNEVVGGRQVPGSGCASCPGNATAVYEGGIRPPDNYQSQTSSFGIRTENFVIWMRTAALPHFRKLYGRIVPKGDFTGFKAGDRIGIRIIPNFLVESFQGSKALVLSTANSLDSRNDVLGIAYLVVGLLCLLLAFIFSLKLKINPRKLGDPKYLNWKPN